jgi:Integrase core domain
MGKVGSSADNAMAESINASLKRETLQGAHGWDSAHQARRAGFAWITRYNTRRRHSTCGYLSPVTYEHTTAPATLQKAVQPQIACSLLGVKPLGGRSRHELSDAV